MRHIVFAHLGRHHEGIQKVLFIMRVIAPFYKSQELLYYLGLFLSGNVLRAKYEDVVADTEQQVRRILDYCGLPFQRSCREFYNNQRPVRTASSEQVRQPIYSSSLEHWRNFELYLVELKQSLGTVLDRYPLH